MALPVIFRNVSYRVAGSSKYKGDLILTPEAIYYFPQHDATNKRFLVIAIILLIVSLPLLVAIAWIFARVIFLYLMVVLFVFVAVGVSTPDLIVEMLTSAIEKAWELIKDSQVRHHHIPEPNDELQLSETVALSTPISLYPIILYPTLWYSLILDSALLALKENKPLSRYSLPAPIRFSKGDVRDISLSSRGLLIIKTEYDMENEFNLDSSRKDMLKNGLIEGGFIS
jgi:hypothetical protein